MTSTLNCVLFVCMWVGLVSYVNSSCPEKPLHGHWDEDKNNDRCILRCDGGYEPSGCHIIRNSTSEGKWNHDVPRCQEGWPVSGKTLVAVGTGAAVVAATPFVLAGAGFTAAGVAAGSIAAMIQTPFTVGGGWFALSQSAGVVGTALATKGVVGAGTSLITYATLGLLSDCEKE